MPIDAGDSKPAPSRPFRDRPLGRVVILVVVLAIPLLIFLFSGLYTVAFTSLDIRNC